MNTFGTNLRLTTFGESHGPAIGGILDGMPSGIKIDFDAIAKQMERRRPGNKGYASARNETDEIRWLSGISSEGITLGTPIGFIIENRDARPTDYKDYIATFRPNHADFTYFARYGIMPQSGGGRASARETANWVAAGALVRQWLESTGIAIRAAITEINGNSEDFDKELEEARKNGDSVGGIVSCTISGMPAGVGEPVFHKLHATLAQAMMTINAAKGFEYGLGFEAARIKGTDQADIMIPDTDSPYGIKFTSNHSGGIQGGISNGMDINFRVAFKPTPTLMKTVDTVDTSGGQVSLHPKGRHDVCVALRAVPVVEAMAALVTGDFLKPYYSSK